MDRRRLLRGLGGLAGWPMWRSLGLGLAVTGCAAGAGRAERVSRFGVKISWQIPLGDAPTYSDRLAWAPDSRRLAVGSATDKRMSVWDVRDKRRLPAPDDQAGGVDALAFSPDGRYLAVSRGSIGRGDESYSVSIRDALTGVLIQGLPWDLGVRRDYKAGSIAFSPDGRYLAVGYLPYAALYLRDGSEWRHTGGLGPGGHRIAFSGDGASLAIWGTGRDPAVSICRVPSLEVVRRLASFGGPEWGYVTLAYRLSGGQIAAGRGADLAIFEPGEGKLLKSIRFLSISGLAYSPDGQRLAVANSRSISLMDSESWIEIGTLNIDQGPLVHQIAFSPDGTMLAGAAGPTVKLWQFSG